MKIIDEKGKLFGIVNIIDIFIVLAIVAVGVFVYHKLTSKVQGVTNRKPITLKFYSEESPGYVEKYIIKGERVEDEGNDNFLGTIKEVNIDQGFMYVGDEDGQLHKGEKEDYISIEITTEVDAELFDNGAMIGRKRYEVGHPITIRAGKGKVFGKISALLPKE